MKMPEEDFWKNLSLSLSHCQRKRKKEMQKITCCQQTSDTSFSLWSPTGNCLLKFLKSPREPPHIPIPSSIPSRLDLGAWAALGMALRAAVGFNGGLCHLGSRDLRRNGRLGGGTSLGWRLEVLKFGKLDCEGLLMKPVDDQNPASSSSSSLSSLEAKQEMGNGVPGEEVKKRSRDLSTLPRPLSAIDVSASNNGSNVRVAYQGSPGAFSESAAIKAYPECETVPCEQFEVVFKAVELWLVDKAVLPIENTFSGSIHRNYDLLLRHSLHIVGEVHLKVDYCLMALPGVKKKELKRVLSHPLALAQCSMALSELGVIQENADDTAAAAQFVSTNGSRDVGAVASARAASIYGLDMLEEKIQDNHNSITRFLILAREPIIPRMDRPFKTSIVFTLEEGPGVIFKALSVFALRSINLSKIESRPQTKQPLRVVDDSNGGTSKYFDYLFYIDIEASMAEPRAQSALAHLQEYSKFLRILGSYPTDIFL